MSDGIGLILHKTKNLEILDKYQNKAELCLACSTPSLIHTHTPHPLTPTTICQKLSYKFLFVSIFKHDGEELSLYTRGRLYLSSSASTRKQEKAPIAAGGGRKGSETAGLAGREVN